MPALFAKIQKSKALELLRAHSIPLQQQQAQVSPTPTPTPTRYDYGTAGFRYNASIMAPVMVRVGLLARLLLTSSYDSSSSSSCSNGNGNMGVMITASHNDESYNGVKISAPDGSMISPNLEALLIQWVNENDWTKWEGLLSEWEERQGHPILESTSSSSPSSSPSPLLSWHVGRDTRSHSLEFSQLVVSAAECVGVTVVDHGIVTTPVLHWCVRQSNTSQKGSASDSSRDAYLLQLAKAYHTLEKQFISLGMMTTGSGSGGSGGSDGTPLQVDGACGVGYAAVQDFQTTLSTLSKQGTYAQSNRFVARNPPGSGPLNEQCGSEHVQKQLMAPIWYDCEDKTKVESQSQPADTETKYACSVDGDADRIVFWSKTLVATATSGSDDAKYSMTLLDGDKIAVLIARFLQQLQTMKIKKQDDNDHDHHDDQQQSVLSNDLTMGVVQTAYANGASTQYLQNTLQIPVVITKTGVKHLHHAALQFDIGIYFEANGHGTVLFSDKFMSQAQAAAAAATDTKAANPLLQALADIINPAVGDALSDLLLVDLLLRQANWTLDDWATKLYTDLPSRQLKVKVEDRSMIVCNDNETQTLAPNGLQQSLNEAMTAYPLGRCFVRPSGTENVVRIYAEASTREAADRLATQAAHIVHEQCRGVGPLPKI